MQHSVRQQVRNSLRHRTGVKPTIETKFLQKTYFARILSCKPILQEEKCESKYDTKCETQYATEYEEVKRILFYIQCFPDLLLIPRFVVPRQGQSSRLSTTTSDILLLCKQIRSPSADVRQSTSISARLNTRRFTMKFVKMPHRKPW